VPVAFRRYLLLGRECPRFPLLALINDRLACVLKSAWIERDHLAGAWDGPGRTPFTVQRISHCPGIKDAVCAGQHGC
jgi:hypothetical protein